METALYEEFYLYDDGDKNYELLKRIKLAFDPNSVMNMGKIVNALKWMKISV
jgi:FAD/FMN-containing dehydrogenase